MIYSVNFLDLTEKISPHAFARYLKDTGWKNFPVKRESVKVFQFRNDKDEAFQVNIPIDKSFSDYKTAMYEAVETVAFVEKQSTEQLMLYLLNPSTDILKIRLDRKDIEQGSILFDDAIRIYENAKKMIVATAQDILHPRRFHQGRTDDAISKFINNCKFGQTEIGSYIISVVCPFAELDETDGYKQLSIFSEETQCANSLTRKVTNRIMNNVSSIRATIDNGDYDKLVAEDETTIISANFFEALAGLNLGDEGTDVEFIAQWSPVVKKNRSENSRVMINHDYYEPIVATIDKLRKSRNAKTKTKAVGRIKKLESSPDVSKRTSGKITIVYLDDNDKKRTVSVDLVKEDYDKAIQAHSEGNYVEIIGELSSSNTILCESFSIIG